MQAQLKFWFGGVIISRRFHALFWKGLPDIIQMELSTPGIKLHISFKKTITYIPQSQIPCLLRLKDMGSYCIYVGLVGPWVLGLYQRGSTTYIDDLVQHGSNSIAWAME